MDSLEILFFFSVEQVKIILNSIKIRHFNVTVLVIRAVVIYIYSIFFNFSVF